MTCLLLNGMCWWASRELRGGHSRMSGAQDSKSMEERISFLESKLRDLEIRLLALEGPQQDNTEPQSVAANMTAEKEESKKSPISVTIVNKKFHKADLMAGDIGDRVDFVLLFKSEL